MSVRCWKIGWVAREDTNKTSKTRRRWSSLGKPKATQRLKPRGIAALRALKAEGERRQLEALLSGEADANDSYVEVHSGAGGTESCDWARMLLRMYMRWGERRKFGVELIEETDGDEAGHQIGDHRRQGP